MIPGVSIPMVGFTDAVIEVVLAAGSTGINLQTLFTTQDWASDVKKRVILPPGVTRGSTVRTTPAIHTGTGRGGSLEVIINGTVEGCGAPATTTLVAGLDGGDCFLAEQSGVILLGSGLMRSGGGAGGKGGNGSYTGQQGPIGDSLHNVAEPEWGGQYWGWAGVDKTPGGYNADGWTYYKVASHFSINERVWYYPIYRIGPIGTTSGNSGRGQGHDAAKNNGVAGGSGSGLSGNGGDWGQPGTNGANGNNGSGTTAGLAGFALKNISNITNLFTGTLQGRTG